jgi:hypothetical protein
MTFEVSMKTHRIANAGRDGDFLSTLLTIPVETF